MIANLKRIQKRPGANAFGLFFRVGFAAALAACAAQAAPVMGLRDGEALTYSVRWGLIPSVGRIKIAAEILGTGSDAVLRVTTTTASWGLARGIFPFDARGESIYSVNSGKLLSISEWSTYRAKETKDSITFDYGRMTAMFSDDIHPEKSHPLPMPGGDPSDLILALIRTRDWNLTAGQSRDTLVIFKDQVYPLTIRPEDQPEFVFSSLGIFKSTVLVPRMEKATPIGMFKKGGTVRVWIANDDPRHLPVRFEVGFKVGTGTATLIEYQPPK